MYDLDASALAMLAATARDDSMTVEEYAADVLARRVIAETEQEGFPFNELRNLQVALKSAVSNLSIDQGVELRHAQHAVRSLMNDIVWRRPGWWEPRATRRKIRRQPDASL